MRAGSRGMREHVEGKQYHVASFPHRTPLFYPTFHPPAPDSSLMGFYLGAGELSHGGRRLGVQHDNVGC